MSKYEAIFNKVKGIYQCDRNSILEVIERTVDYRVVPPSISDEKLVMRCSKGDIIDLISSRYSMKLFGRMDCNDYIFTDIPKIRKAAGSYIVSYSVINSGMMMGGELLIEEDLPALIRDMKLNRVIGD